MAHITAELDKEPLGVGAIISESCWILSRNFPIVFLVSVVSALLLTLVEAVVYGVPFGTGTISSTAGYGVVLGELLFVVIDVAISGVMTALLVQMAYDAKLGRPISLRSYITTATPVIPQIVVLSVLVGVMTLLGVFALIIGALWVVAVFYVVTPVIVIERGSYGSLARSAELTKEYRWSIVGVCLVFGFFNRLAGRIGDGLFGSTYFATDQVTTFLLAGTAYSLLIGLAYALVGIATALVYARLREIKEGVAVDEIAAVFD